MGFLLGAFQTGGPPDPPKRARLGALVQQVKATAQPMPPMPPGPGPGPPPATAVGFLHIDNGNCTVRVRARLNKHPLPPTPQAASLTSAAPKPPKAGPYKTTRWTLHSPAHDASNKAIHVTAPAVPISQNFTQFPLIAYAHGFEGGGALDIHGYDDLFHQIASYGFVVAAHASCNTGCTRPGGASRWTSCGGLPELKPAGVGWESYYAETLKTIDFARNGSHSPPFDLVDFSLGVGVAGHSMGGQATAVAAATSCTSAWDIRAAAIHHAADSTNGASGRNVGENISVPTASFTSTGDA